MESRGVVVGVSWLPNGDGALDISWCYTGFNCGSGCDIVNSYDNGGSVTFCVKRTSLTPATQIRIKISPWPPNPGCPVVLPRYEGENSLRHYVIGDTVRYTQDTCVHVGGGLIGGYDSCWTLHKWYVTDSSFDRYDWKQDSVLQNGDSLVVYYSPGAANVFACNTWCFTIPKCTPLIWHNVSIVTMPADSNPTTPCRADTTGAAFKSASQAMHLPEHAEVESNYPNPFGKGSWFRTCIPFVLTEAGTAKLRVVDEKGKLVLEDELRVTAAGRHFFYVSSSALSSGKYFYTIVGPGGTPIVNSTMLVIK